MNCSEWGPYKMQRRRSSSSITLVLISATAISSCGQSSAPDTMSRDLYASKADCMQDWGADPAKCEPARTGSSTRTTTGTHFYGPAYSRGSYGSTSRSYPDGTTSEPRPGSRSIGTTNVSRSSVSSGSSSGGSVSRSGFGSSSSSHSSSSSSRSGSSAS